MCSTWTMDTKMINLSCMQISLVILTLERLSVVHYKCKETELNRTFRRRTEGTRVLKTRQVGSFRFEMRARLASPRPCKDQSCKQTVFGRHAHGANGTTVEGPWRNQQMPQLLNNHTSNKLALGMHARTNKITVATC